MDYRVILLDSAERELRKLDRQVVYLRLRKAIAALGGDPRPPGCLKLSTQSSYRIRVGDYRVIYEIEDAIRVVSVTKVGPRGGFYDRLP